MNIHYEALTYLGTVPQPIRTLAGDLGIKLHKAKDVVEQLMARGYKVVLTGGKHCAWSMVAVTKDGMTAVREDAEAYLRNEETGKLD